MKFKAIRGTTRNDAGYLDECILMRWTFGNTFIEQAVVPEANFKLMLYMARLLKKDLLQYLGGIQ